MASRFVVADNDVSEEKEQFRKSTNFWVGVFKKRANFENTREIITLNFTRPHAITYTNHSV